MKQLPLLALLLVIVACIHEAEPVAPEERALVPAAEVRQTGGIYPVRAPLHVHDPHYPLVEWSETGERFLQEYDLVLFPTDVIVVFTEQMAVPLVFLARSPHGGCLVRWEAELEHFVDPCYGSHFSLEGRRLQGPAQQGLDRLPAEVRGEIIWARGVILPGERID